MARTKLPPPTTVYLTQAQKDALPKLAKKSGLKVAEVIRRAVDLALSEDTPLNGLPGGAQSYTPPTPTSTSTQTQLPQPATPAVTTKPTPGEIGVSGTTI